MSYSKLIKLIILLVIVATVGYGIYYLSSSKEDNEITQQNQGNFPYFGNNNSTNGNGTSQNNNGSTSNINGTSNNNSTQPKLRQISKTPTAGGVLINLGTTTKAVYIDRGVGHIYEHDLNLNKTVKISNTTIPKIYESIWSKKGNSLIIKYLGSDDNSVLSRQLKIIDIPKTNTVATDNVSTTTPNTTPEDLFLKEIESGFLPEGIKSIASSPKDVIENSVIYATSENSKEIVYTQNLTNGRITQIYSSPFQNFDVFWPNKNTLALQTKPTYFSKGFLYFYDLNTKETKKIISGRGLSTLISPDSLNIAYSEIVSQNVPIIYIFDTKNKIKKETLLRTFAEKCVWNQTDSKTIYCATPTDMSQMTYPDDWYKGKTNFNDKIWKYDTNTGVVELKADLYLLSNQYIDATNISIDQNESFLMFTNKNDLSLWVLEI